MSQILRSTIAQPVRIERDNPHFGAAVLAMTMVAAVFGGIVVLAPATNPRAVAIPAAHQQLVDGWLPAANAAVVARLDRVRDGYLPGLVNARRDSDLTDGYLPGLVNARPGSDLTDGYLGGLIAAMTTGDPVDGWMPAFSGRGQGVELRDGWESALMR